jgi:hypothetical protein
LIVALILTVWLGPSLMRSVGILPPDAEELFSGSPDPVATEAMNNILESSGVVGVEALVIPIAGTDGQLAVFSVDANTFSAGGIGNEAEADLFLKDMMGQLVQANRDQDLSIEHVTIDYLDGGGENLVAITAPQGAVEAYASGAISRREFLAQVEIDFSNIITSAELRQLIEESQ